MVKTMPDLQETLGLKYLQDTKFNRKSIREKERPSISSGSAFKNYPDAEKVTLPRSWQKKESNLEQLLQERRSVRQYSRVSVSMDDLAFLLWAMQGVTAQAGPYLLRTAPSAGALYPIETYLAVDRVEGLDAGLYHFDVKDFQLERLTDQSVSSLVADSALNQGFIAKGAITFIWSAVFRRNMGKYGHRGLRYIFLDCGHICQNLLLAAQALGLNGCPVAAFYDDEMNDLLDLDGVEESVIYLTTIG
jgi:SagB-type dehydrogenase family enzyme